MAFLMMWFLLMGLHSQSTPSLTLYRNAKGEESGKFHKEEVSLSQALKGHHPPAASLSKA